MEAKKEKPKSKRLQDVFKNVEYLLIKKNNRQLLVFDEKEINGKSRTELQKIIGNRLGEGTYVAVIKYLNDPKLITGRITALMQNPVGEKVSNDEIGIIAAQLRALQEQIGNQTSNADIKLLMDMKDQAYKIQIDFYKSRIDQLEKTIEKLENEAGSENNGGGLDLSSLLQLLIQAQGNKNVG